MACALALSLHGVGWCQATAGPQTLTGDWFGAGAAWRDAGNDFRLEWSQFYQGMTRGEGEKSWQYGGKLDALARIDLSRLGVGDDLSLTAQGQWNYGHSVNGIGGTLLPVNAALFFPGIEDSDRSDLMALYLTKRFGDRVSVSVGKLSGLELLRATPLKGGGGVDTFWGNVGAPISGIAPATFHGAHLQIRTQPVSYTLLVYDPEDATNRPLFSDLFDNGVTFNGQATWSTAFGGLRGYYGLKAAYSTREGTDFSEIIRPPGLTPGTKQGSWLLAFAFQQYLAQNPDAPARGWGVFGEIAKSDGNPNLVDWATYVGIGGSGLIPDRPDDRFGIAYFRLRVSDVLREELAPVFNLRDESGVELFYNLAVTPWFRITGDLQFIRPAAGDLPRSTYAGLGTYVRF